MLKNINNSTMNNLQQAKEAIASANKDTILNIYTQEWRKLKMYDRIALEKWWLSFDVHKRLADAPSNKPQGEKKELHELILTPEQIRMNDEDMEGLERMSFEAEFLYRESD